MSVDYNQSGYVGQSMSERAKRAYESGEKPISKWSKSELVTLARMNYGDVFAEMIKRRPVEQLRSELLYKSSWHHTGKFAVRTDFYSFNDDLSEEQVNSILASKPWAVEKKEDQKTYWAVGKYFYTENRGSKRWPKIFDCEDVVLCFRKEGQKAWETTYGKKIFNFKPLKIWDKKPRKNAKELKDVGRHSESQRW